MSLHPGKKSIKGVFSAIAAYEVENLPKLVNFRHVLDALSENRKNGLSLSELEDFVDQKLLNDPRDKTALSYVSGNNPFGYAVSFVAATDDKGKTAYMPVIFDQLQDMTLVVGPAKLPPAAMRAMRDAKVTYVNQHDGEAAGKINDFIVRTAVYRGQQDKLGQDQVLGLIEGLLDAAYISGATDGTPFNERTTMGALLINGIKAEATPKLYVAAAKTRIFGRS